MRDEVGEHVTERDNQPETLEIDTAARRRWVGWIAYVLLFLVVAAILVFFFMQLNTSFRLAAGIVVFMIGYMVIMGWFASGKLDRRE